MPLILVIGGLLVSSLFGVASVLDKIDDIKNDNSQTGGLINAGSIALIVVGGLAVWYVTKKK